MKGSAITGPVGKEAAELWPVCLDWYLKCPQNLITNTFPAYRQQFRCCDVRSGSCRLAIKTSFEIIARMRWKSITSNHFSAVNSDALIGPTTQGMLRL